MSLANSVEGWLDLGLWISKCYRKQYGELFSNGLPASYKSGKWILIVCFNGYPFHEHLLEMYLIILNGRYLCT